MILNLKSYPLQIFTLNHRKRGCFDDYDRGAEMILNELEGKLGRLSFETLEDLNTNEMRQMK